MQKMISLKGSFQAAVTLLGLFGLMACTTSQSAPDLTKSAIPNSATKIFLVRHAEKDLTDKSDPALTERGVDRAKNLAKLLTHVELDAIFSTDTMRTRDTAKPTADAKSMAVKLYDPRAIDYQEFLERISGQTVLVVGHSNTIPSFTNALLGENRYMDLDESEYSSVFVVSIAGDIRQAHRYLID